MISSRSLRKVILLLSFVNFATFTGGILYLSQDYFLIVEAQRERLRALSEVLASTIAADNSLASERVSPILLKLAATGTRAQVYAHDGALMVDTAPNLESTADDDRHVGIACIKSLGRLMWRDPPTRREMVGADSTIYPEVRSALSGSVAPLLMVNEQGERILSMATPIQYRQAIQGALLLSTLPGEIDELLHERARAIVALCALNLVLSFAVGIISYCLVGQIAGSSREP